MNEDELTFRQVVLLKVLKSGVEKFTKKTMVPKVLDRKEWKYCNSLVDGNCLWFGGQTTRKDSTERQPVHQEQLGFENKLKLITHADATHRTYKAHRENIKRYLLATLSRKYTFGKLPEVIEFLEEKFEIELRNIMVV